MRKYVELFQKDYYRMHYCKRYKWYKYITLNYPEKLMYWWRKASFSKGLFRFFNKLVFYTICSRHNNEISLNQKVAGGLALVHCSNRVIHGDCSIGENVNIYHNVTIGQETRGVRKGAPTILNNVFIGANSTIVGKITIGNNVLIAPNTFVNFDVPDNSIVIGNPAKVISKANATKGYINKRIDEGFYKQ